MSEMLNISNHLYNMNIINDINDRLNDFLDDTNYRLYFYDSEGNVFIPSGKINIVAVTPIYEV